MKRKAYGRDAGLSLRMLFTSSLLGLLYVGFALALFYLLNAGLVLMLMIGIGVAIFQYYTSDKIALAASGAKVVGPDEAPRLHAMVERLCAMADLRKPRVAVVDTDVPNAFATGRNQKHAVVAVTRGLWERLDEKEVEGVLAHELSHIANRDVLVMTVASFFAMLAALLTRFGLYAGMFGGFGGGNRDSNNNSVPIWLIVIVVSFVTYILSWVLIRTISRYREYSADRGSALITGAPEYLMSALQKISSQITLIPQQDLRQVEGMNAFFIIPARVKEGVNELFMDHPPLEKRLAALEQIARETGRPISRAICSSAASRFSSGGWSMNSSFTPSLTRAGMMKNAFIPSTWRRSCCGISVIWLEIFCSALIRYSGAPVITAEPRSAAYSR